jgi:amidohydrolase
MLRKAIAAMLAAGALQPALAQRDTDSLVNDVEVKVIEWRRHIHQYPELSYQEVKTAAYVAAALRAMPGLDVQTGIAKTGIKAILKGSRPGPVVALRADMDALPVEERNSLPFRSQAKAMWQGQETGVMHACGHDAHVAMLLGAAEILSKIRADLAGTVVFLFQPAEEWGAGPVAPSGANAMVAEGAMDNPKVDAVFGQHISAGHPAGSIRYRRGATMASFDGFNITVKGTSGHAASPWSAKDPIVTGAQIVTSLQSIVSRQVNLSEGAAVVTVGQFNAGNRANIIPETATIAGTIRTLNETTRKQVTEAVTRMAENVAAASGLTAEVSISSGYPVLHNDPELSSRMLEALARAAGTGRVLEIPPVLASEDFGAFASRAPGFFWFLNASPHPDRGGAPNHSPLFMIDEQYLKTGVKALVNVTLAYLGAAKQR